MKLIWFHLLCLFVWANSIALSVVANDIGILDVIFFLLGISVVRDITIIMNKLQLEKIKSD